MAHSLIIDIQDSSNDTKFIHVRDYSIWDSVLEVKDRIFQILPPYSDKYYIVPVPEGSLMAVNGSLLGLTSSHIIPDGFYKYHYSVSPNKEVNVIGSHYRVAVFKEKVLNKMINISLNTDVSIDACGNIAIDKEYKMLLHINSLLDSAAAAGRTEVLKPKADKLYEMAVRHFNRLYDESCITC